MTTAIGQLSVAAANPTTVVPARDARRVRRDGALRSVLVIVALLVTGCGGVAADAGDVAQAPGNGVAGNSSGSALPPTTPCPEPVRAGSGAGARLPDVTLPCLGQPTELALRQLPSTPVVLSFWASWCDICREEMPGFQRVAQEVGDQVVFLGVDVKDGREQARSLLDDLGVTYATLYDESGRSLDLLPSPGVPTTLVLAPDGEIVDRTMGAMGEDELRKLLTERLGVRLVDDAAPATD